MSQADAEEKDQEKTVTYDDGSPELIGGYELINQPGGTYKSIINSEEPLTQEMSMICMMDTMMRN